MKPTHSIINVNEIESFYREHCNENGKRFTKKEFLSFIKFCEIDFFQWVKDNLKHFEPGLEKHN